MKALSSEKPDIPKKPKQESQASDAMQGLRLNGDHKAGETSKSGHKRSLDDVEEPASAKKRKIAESDDIVVVGDEVDNGGAIVIDD